jgi:hypothetical protein
MVKPVGSACNLACVYCYYLHKGGLLDQPAHPRMSDELLEEHIRQYIEAQTGEEVVFSWQGGEPTLLGLDFFRRVVELQAKYRQPFQRSENDLQTNGTLLDGAWAAAGGGIEFMRPWTEKVYGIPPEQVVGSSIKTKFEMRDSKPVLVRLPELNFIDDKAGKPVGIHQHIGRRPIAAFGNSDGDLQMLQWTAAGSGSRFCLLVHYTDGGRAWAYDRTSSIGRLDKALDEAKAREWTVVDMKQDWGTIYPPKAEK